MFCSAVYVKDKSVFIYVGSYASYTVIVPLSKCCKCTFFYAVIPLYLCLTTIVCLLCIMYYPCMYTHFLLNMNIQQRCYNNSI